MPKYDVKGVTTSGTPTWKLEAQRLGDDGRWSPLQRCAEVDTDAGTAEVYLTQDVGSRALVTGTFRVVDKQTGEVNPALAAEPAAEPAQ